MNRNESTEFLLAIGNAMRFIDCYFQSFDISDETPVAIYYSDMGINFRFYGKGGTHFTAYIDANGLQNNSIKYSNRIAEYINKNKNTILNIIIGKIIAEEIIIAGDLYRLQYAAENALSPKKICSSILYIKSQHISKGFSFKTNNAIVSFHKVSLSFILMVGYIDTNISPEYVLIHDKLDEMEIQTICVMNKYASVLLSNIILRLSTRYGEAANILNELNKFKE